MTFADDVNALLQNLLKYIVKQLPSLGGHTISAKLHPHSSQGTVSPARTLLPCYVCWIKALSPLTECVSEVGVAVMQGLFGEGVDALVVSLAVVVEGCDAVGAMVGVNEDV